MEPISLADTIADLYGKVRVEGRTTSTMRLRKLAEFCRQELAGRGLDGVALEPQVPGFARTKAWDVAWAYQGKIRLAISLKSILTNLGGTVPNRIDDLIGEVANAQMASPEIVIGYVMIFNRQEDEFSRVHRCTWGELLSRRLGSISGRRAPHWTAGTVEASVLIGVDFRTGPDVVSGTADLPVFFDTLCEQVRMRNPGVGGEVKR